MAGRVGVGAWVVAGLLTLCGPGLAEEPKPRRISETERAAVELAARYLAEGAEAWRERLAPESPWSGLEAEAAVREIEVRAGPPEGAAWTLRTPAPGTAGDAAVFSVVFPSGAEDTLSLRLREAGPREQGQRSEDGTDGGWRIVGLRSLSEPAPAAGEPFFFEKAGGAPAAERTARAPGAPQPSHTTIVGLLLAAGVGLGAAVLARRRALAAGAPRWARTALAAIPVLALPPALILILPLILVGACGGSEEPDSPGEGPVAEGPELRQPRLGSLRDVRWSLATDGDPVAVESEIERIAPTGLQHQVAELWRAELLMKQVDLREVEAILADLPEPGPVPLADLLRARLATTRGDDQEASWKYDRVRSVGPDHDGLRLEIATALGSLGFGRMGEIEITQATEMGSRRAEVWYAGAQVALVESRREQARSFLRTAWAQKPMPRDELLANPLLAHLTSQPSLLAVIEPSNPTEPIVEPVFLATRPIRAPEGARASAVGRCVRIEIPSAAGGDPARIEVPGGAEIAPRGVRATHSSEWRDRAQEAALADLDHLREQVQALTAFSRPRFRRRLLEAATALAEHNRWDELAWLTDGIERRLERVPPLLGQLRARALQQTSRSAAARKLLIELAKISMDGERPAPAMLYQLAELFVGSHDYDLAVRLIRKADSVSSLTRNETRIRQIELEKWLDENRQAFRSDHFEVVYPRMTGDVYPEALAEVLEAERERIGRWVPLPRSALPVEVHLFPLKRFLQAYSTEMMVLGFYDGEVQVPFADIRSLHPELVSVLSHEVAHALIGRATFDQAPNWFHEGLAQHVEMLHGRINPIPDLAERDRVIAFPLLEPILDGFAEPQLVELAYGESAWVVHYLEAEFGVEAIHGLVAAFRKGRTTDEALREVVGMDRVRFDRAFRAWALEEAPAAWSTEQVRYDRRAGIPFRPTNPSDEQDPDEGRMAMRQWHAAYRSEVARFKRSLGDVIAKLKRKQLPRMSACAGLELQVDEILDDRSALHPPDRRAGSALREAFEHFATMATACREGRTFAARRHLGRAEAALGRAAGAMERYGLKP